MIKTGGSRDDTSRRPELFTSNFIDKLSEE